MQKKKQKTFVVGGVVAAALALAAIPALAESDGAEPRANAVASPQETSAAVHVSSSTTAKASEAKESEARASAVKVWALRAAGIDVDVDDVVERGSHLTELPVTEAPVTELPVTEAPATADVIQLPAEDAGVDQAGDATQPAVPAEVPTDAGTESEVVADTVRPTATLIAPTTSAAQKSSVVDIQVDAEDNQGLARITANIYQKDGNDKNVLVQSTSTRVEGVKGTHKAIVVLPKGNYTIRYNAQDVAGNTSRTSEFPIAIDQTRPTVNLVTPSTGMVSGLDIEVVAQDAHGLDRITANIYQGTTLVKSTSTRVGGADSGSHIAKVNGLADGTYTIRYNASDLAGNISSTGNYTVTLDTVAPTVTLKDGAKPGEKSFKLYDAGQIDRLTVNGVDKDLTDNAWSDLNGVKPGEFGAKEGQNTLVVFDRAGNTTTVDFVLDTVDPKVTGIQQSYQAKEGGRMAVTLTFSEPIAAAPGQGWYGSGNSYTKVYYSVKGPQKIDFMDIAGNVGSYTFTVEPIVAAVA